MDDILSISFNDDHTFLRSWGGFGQKVILQPFVKRLMHLSNYAEVTKYRRGLHLYYFLQWSFWWPNTLMSCYAIVQDFVSSANNRVTLQNKQQRHVAHSGDSPSRALWRKLTGFAIHYQKKEQILAGHCQYVFRIGSHSSSYELCGRNHSNGFCGWLGSYIQTTKIALFRQWISTRLQVFS